MIARHLALTLALALLPAVAAAAAEVHHAAELRLSPDDGAVEAVDRITVSEDGPLAFRLAPGLRPRHASVGAWELALEPRGDGWVLGPVPASTTVEIAYGGRLAGGNGEQAPTLGDGLGFLPAGAGWLPEIGEAEATFQLMLDLPQTYDAVATGRLDEEEVADGRRRIRFVQDVPGEGPSAFIGSYEVAERQANGVTVRTYFDAPHAQLADIYLDQALGYIDHYVQHIGPYPYPSLAIVAGPLPIGVAFPGLTYVSSRILPLPFMQTTSLAHEVLHNWWGNAVAVRYEDGNWAEGLTTYMADYALAEAESQEKARQLRLAWLRDYNALSPELDRPLAAFVAKDHDAAQVVGYNKSAFLFHMLRRRVGDPIFEKAIRRFFNDYRHQRAGWSELEGAFAIESGESLDRFFAQWLTRAGAPRLHLEAAAWRPEGDGFALSLRLRQEAPAYSLSVPVRVDTDRGFVRRDVAMADERAEATIVLAGRPRAVVVDPDYHLFRRLAPGEAPPILRDVTLNPDTSLLVADKDPGVRAVAKELAASLIDNADAPPAEAVDANGSLLLVGTSSAVAAALSANGLGARPAKLASYGSARVWSVRRAAGATALVVEGNDAPALKALLRPLPHYRRESFLVFDGDRVIDRGVWPAGDSELTRKFN